MQSRILLINLQQLAILPRQVGEQLGSVQVGGALLEQQTVPLEQYGPPLEEELEEEEEAKHSGERGGWQKEFTSTQQFSFPTQRGVSVGLQLILVPMGQHPPELEEEELEEEEEEEEETGAPEEQEEEEEAKHSGERGG